MFKRVDRRRKRKEKEEELGLDEDERDILGLNNTDSSESDSDSSSSSSAQAPSGNKRKRRTAHDESDDDEDSQSTSGDEVVDSEEDVGDSLFSISSALKEPIQLIRADPEAWVCVFCPNKVLKHMSMVKVHEASQARKLRIWSGHRAHHGS